MNVTQAELKKQLKRVVDSGWWPYLQAAAQAYFPTGPYDEYDLFAVGSRETNWNPIYLSQPGDNGNGFGPLQVDKRTAPEWIASGAWKDPKKAIHKGASILKAKHDQAYDRQGTQIERVWNGEVLRMTAKNLTTAQLKHVGLSAYNSGLWALWHISKGRSPDRGTTGGDYGKDVLERAAAARKLVKPEPTKTCPKCHGTGRVEA